MTSVSGKPEGPAEPAVLGHDELGGAGQRAELGGELGERGVETRWSAAKRQEPGMRGEEDEEGDRDREAKPEHPSDLPGCEPVSQHDDERDRQGDGDRLEPAGSDAR
jgi:hypothetical protein